MFAEIPAAIAAIKESLSLFNTIKDANNQAEINNAVVDITTKLNSILLENTRLLEIINEKQKSISLLEKALAEEETKKANEEKWALESLNYEAWNPMTGTTLYRHKSDEGIVGSFSNFCPKCYLSGKASVLSVQSVETKVGIGAHIATLICHCCKSSYLAPASKLKGR